MEELLKQSRDRSLNASNLGPFTASAAEHFIQSLQKLPIEEVSDSLPADEVSSRC